MKTLSLLLIALLCLLGCETQDEEFPIFCEDGYILSDGSCCYIAGCMDTQADNYNPNVCYDDATCVFSGCMDTQADNYNPNANIDDGSCANFSVFAGIFDNTFNYNIFFSPFEIEMIWDSLNIYGQGEGFIDLDLDGAGDIKFNIGGYNQENINTTPQFFNRCLLTPLNGFEIAYSNESFGIGLGQSSSVDIVSQLNFTDGIDLLINWYSDSIAEIRMFYENPGIVPFGSWYYATETYYIGVRKNDKYGWIELDMSEGCFPKIISYAIEQN